MQRFNPLTGTTTFTTPEGEDYVTRENHDGSLSVVDPMGMVAESNPLTGATAVTFADGSSQETKRLEDGGLQTGMIDGMTVTAGADGHMTYVDEEGNIFEPTVNDNGSVQTNTPDGVEQLALVDDEGNLSAAYVGPSSAMAC